MLKELQEKNKELILCDVQNPMFFRYGKFHHTVEPMLVCDDSSIEQCLTQLGIDLEEMSYKYFGGQSVQATTYTGRKQYLDTVEYHNSCELLLALDDFVLAVGDRSELSYDYTYDTKHLRGVYVKKGQLIELHPTTLHSDPFEVTPSGVQVLSITPKKTGRRLKQNHTTALSTYNTWTLAHEKSSQPTNELYVGLEGTNYYLNY